MISIALMLAAAAPAADVNPLADISRKADPICAAMVRASDNGVSGKEIAAIIRDKLSGFGADSVLIYCAGYLSGAVAERERS